MAIRYGKRIVWENERFHFDDCDKCRDKAWPQLSLEAPIEYLLRLRGQKLICLLQNAWANNDSVNYE